MIVKFLIEVELGKHFIVRWYFFLMMNDEIRKINFRVNFETTKNDLKKNVKGNIRINGAFRYKLLGYGIFEVNLLKWLSYKKVFL